MVLSRKPYSLGLVLDGNVAAGVVALAPGADGLKVLVVELDGLKVALDAVGGDGLGDLDEVLLQTPSNEDLGGGLTELLGDLLDGLSVNVARLARHIVAERRVGGEVDIVVLQVREELGLDERRVRLDLVHGGDDAGRVDDLLEVLDGEVRDTDGADLLRLPVDTNDLLPGVDDRGTANVEESLTVLRGRELLTRLEGDGPVDKVQVEVVGAELLQRRVEVSLDVLGAVRVVPELRGDEDVLAIDARVLDARSDLFLVAWGVSQPSNISSPCLPRLPSPSSTSSRRFSTF